MIDSLMQIPDAVKNTMSIRRSEYNFLDKSAEADVLVRISHPDEGGPDEILTCDHRAADGFAGPGNRGRRRYHPEKHGRYRDLQSCGAEDVTIDGKIIKGDPRRAGGVHANAVMWIDPHLKNTCMIDKVGGSVSFYDTKVRLVKV